MKGDTDILDAMPWQCGMCEKWERDSHQMERGRCPVREEEARAALAGHGLPDPTAVHVYLKDDADASLCIDFEWTDAALSEAIAIAQYHATKDAYGRSL